MVHADRDLSLWNNFNDHYAQHYNSLQWPTYQQLFQISSSLANHKYIHRGLKNGFRSCNKGFPFKSQLNTHRLIIGDMRDMCALKKVLLRAILTTLNLTWQKCLTTLLTPLMVILTVRTAKHVSFIVCSGSNSSAFYLWGNRCGFKQQHFIMRMCEHEKGVAYIRVR